MTRLWSISWSILFFLFTAGCLAAFLLAANNVEPLKGAWLPENFSENGIAIDRLFYLAHWICAVFFVGIGCMLALFVWKFSAPNREKASFFRGNTTLEIVWTLIPAAILIWLAVFQMQAWSAQRVDRPTLQVGGQTLPKPPLVRVIAKQFGWEFQYAGADNRFDSVDDVTLENLMVVPDDETIVMQLESRDVIHSFFVPKLRLKNDVVPGMKQIAWFTPTASADLTIVCAELCGWGHYKMNASLRIVPRNEFDDWILEQQLRIAPSEITRQGG